MFINGDTQANSSVLSGGQTTSWARKITSQNYQEDAGFAGIQSVRKMGSCELASQFQNSSETMQMGSYSFQRSCERAFF